MIKRTWRIAVAWVVFLLLFCAFLLGSGRGLQVVRQGVQLLSGSRVTIGEVQGKLLGNFTLEKFRLVLAGADIKVDTITWNWSPAKLFEGELHIADLQVSGAVIALRDTPETPSSAGPVTLPRRLFPLTFMLDRLAVKSLRIEDNGGGELFTFDTIDVQLAGKDGGLTIGNLSLQGPEIGVAVHGSVDLTRNWHVDLLGNWRLINYGFHQLEGTFSAIGPLAAPHAAFAVNSPADIRVEGDVVNLLEKPEWTATLLARNVDLEALIKHCPKIDLATVNGQLSGNTDGYQGQVQADGTWGELDHMLLQSSITAGLWGIDFAALRIDRGDGWAVAENAKINWKRLFDWEGLFHFKNFDPSAFFTWLPGKLDADLTSVGTVRDDLGVDVAFEIFRLDGKLHEQPVSAVGKVALTENDVRTDDLVIRSGEVEGSARVEKGLLSWAEQLKWSGEIHLDNFDPAGIFPDFPGQVSGLLSVQGFLGPAGVEGFLKISDLGGTLRGNALVGSGEISLSGETIHTTGLFLQSGASQLVVQGQAGESFALDFSLSSPDIAALMPEASGALQLLGKLRGSFNAPLFDVEMDGQGLQLGDSSFSRMEAKVHWQLGENDRLNGTFLAEKMALAGLPLHRAQIDFSGNFKEQDLTGQAAGEFGTLQLRAKASDDNGWMGEISSVSLASSGYGNWRQQDRAGFSFAGKGVALEDFCLVEGEGTICVGGSMQLADEVDWRIKSRFSGLSLGWLNRLKLLGVPVTGLFDGEIAASGESKRLISAQAEVRLPEAHFELGVEDEELNFIHCQDTVLSVALADARLQTHLVTRMKNGSHLTLTAFTPGADLFIVPVRSLPLSGGAGCGKFRFGDTLGFYRIRRRLHRPGEQFLHPWGYGWAAGSGRGKPY